MISKDAFIQYGKKLAEHIWFVGKIYIIWMFIYYIAANLYSYFCAPITIWGFIAAPFMVPLPHCIGLRWCIQHGSEVITAMWVMLGSWIIAGLAGGLPADV